MTRAVSSPTPRTWAPKVELAVLAWVLAAGAGVWAVFTDDPPGRVLVGAVALFLAAAGLYGSVVRPRLAADQRGVTVRVAPVPIHTMRSVPSGPRQGDPGDDGASRIG